MGKYSEMAMSSTHRYGPSETRPSTGVGCWATEEEEIEEEKEAEEAFERARERDVTDGAIFVAVLGNDDADGAGTCLADECNG